jgi:hypothetical protein
VSKNYKVSPVNSLFENLTDLAEAIAAYSAALKLTFIAGMVSFLVVVFLVLPIELPHLGRQKVLADEEDEA